MSARCQSPLSGYPRTVETTDAAGFPRFTITARELTPARAKGASETSRFLGWGLACAAVYSALQVRPLDAGVFVVTFGMAYGIHQVLTAVVTECLRKTTTIVMALEHVELRGLFGAKRFSRDVRHQFEVLPHDLTREEQRVNEYSMRRAGANGRVVMQPVYYGESGHVVLAYAGQRVDLLTVYGLPRAVAIGARLQYCDEALNRASGKSHGLGGSASDQKRRETPGGL